MAQTNFTPILLYASSTSTNVPIAANLTNSATGSEIAINVADKNLFFKDSGGMVNTVPIRQSSTSSNGWLSYTDWNTFNNKASAITYTTNYILYGQGTTTPAQSTNLTFTGSFLSLLGTSAFGASAVRRSDFYFESANRAITATTANLAIGVSTAYGTDVGGQIALSGHYDSSADVLPFGVIKGAKENAISGNYAGYLAFGTSQAGAGFAEAMRISSTQGVSIGNTTDPGAGNLSVSGTVKTQGYTVATLPTGVTGARAYVTNALAPSYGATVVGGGAITIPVFYNGTNWIVA